MAAMSSQIKTEHGPSYSIDGERSVGIHLSAVLACACYAVGVALDIFSAPAMLRNLLTASTGQYVQVSALIGFIVIVAVIQRHMGISLRASQTKTPDRLCTTGPFAYTRNPIYLAFIFPLAALGYFSIFAAAIAIALYVSTTTHFVILREERELRRKFGADFEAYCAVTPRWIVF